MNRQPPNPLVLAYFRSVYQTRIEINAHGQIEEVPISTERLHGEELHLAWSHDGLHWTALNQNRPTWPSRFLRDPFINRGPDGSFHLLATSNYGPRSCLYARSPDLIYWEARELPLMESRPEINNIWAPEWFFDEQADEYFLLWSSSSSAHGWQESRLWYARTRDFQTFSAPRVLLDPGYSVIDGTIVKEDNTYFLFFKEEMFGYHHGERRAIRLATSDALDGPYMIETEPVTSVITEGPSVVRQPNSGQWLLLYDYCMSNDYGASISTDLRSWQEARGIEFPLYARHGSVFEVSPAELQTLIQRFDGSTSDI
jgi:hypothetical protein